MHRVLALALIASTVALAGTASATHQGSSDGEELDCVSVTFVASDHEDFYADVYVSKTGSPPIGSVQETRNYFRELTAEVLQAAEDFMEAEPSSSSAGIVHVEAVLPKNTASSLPGYRIAFIVNLGACTE